LEHHNMCLIILSDMIVAIHSSRPIS